MGLCIGRAWPVRPNIRAKRATTAGCQARAGETAPGAARLGLVACRRRSAGARGQAALARRGSRFGDEMQASRHELTNGAANHEQLPIVHAAKYVTDDGANHLLHAGQAKGGRLLHNEVRLGSLE